MNRSLTTNPESLMFPRSFRLPLLLGTMALAACQSDSAVAPGGATPDRVTIARTVTPLASFGDTAILTTSVVDAAGKPVSGAPLRWTVSAPEVLEPVGPGVFRARANGTAVVRVQIDPAATGAKPSGYFAARLADSIVVTVLQQPARIEPTTADTAFTLLGAVKTIGVRVTDARGNPLTVPFTLQWSSANANIVSVDNNGRATAKGNGRTTLSVRAGNATWSGGVNVNASRSHVSCMQFTQRKRQQSQCVTNTVTMLAAQEKTP